MSGRLLWISTMQALYDDPCLLPLLDREEDTSHGSLAFCDEPESTHSGRPIRREQQGWPGDFSRAVVTVGRLSRAPAAFTRRPWLESWSFVVSVFCRETIKLDNGSSGGAGDLWCQDIRDHVARILGWNADLGSTCEQGFAVLTRRHETTVLPINYNEKQRHWTAQDRFRWLVLSRGLEAPVCVPCGTV